MQHERPAMRTFESTIVANCPFSIASEYVNSYMHRFDDNGSDVATVRLPLRTFGLPLPGSLRHRIHIEVEDSVDVHERNRSRRGLAFEWDAGNPLLPQLHGDLSFRIAAHNQTELVLTGEYSPPLGGLGLLLDRFVGKRIAIATGKALLERIAADMESRERDFRAAHPPNHNEKYSS
jgi:hypothetical protein